LLFVSNFCLINYLLLIFFEEKLSIINVKPKYGGLIVVIMYEYYGIE